MRTIKLVAVSCIGLVSALAPPSAEGQCEPALLPGRGVPGVATTDRSNVHCEALAAWDPDGPGPREPVLVAGGHFDLAGTTPALNVATWDGSTWSALGDGLPGWGQFGVHSLVVHHGELIAGGDLYRETGEPIRGASRWDGAAWRPMGGEFGTVYTLAVYHGALIGAGRSIDDDPLIAQWDGTHWTPLDAGGRADGLPLAMTVYAGRLIVGGAFTHVGALAANHIAAWDGQAWAVLGSGTSGVVLALAEYPGGLAVGGEFTSAGGVPAANIARWNGAWSALGSGSDSAVLAVASYSGDLVATGSFPVAGNPEAAGVARWDGAGWRPVLSRAIPSVESLGTFGDRLIAGGWFYIAGEILASNIAAWDGEDWSALGGGEPVPINVLATDGERVAASRGATVALIDGDPQQLGARFRGGITALIFVGHDPIAGGSFTAVGAQPAAGVARWGGVAWQPLGNPGVTVKALATHNGTLIAAGPAGSGGNLVVARTGSVWRPISPPLTGEIHAMLVWKDAVYVGGSFTFPGPSLVRVARLGTNGWEPVGQNLPHLVECMTVYNGDLVIGGWFTGIGPGAVNGVARLDGPEWKPLGAGLVAHVLALTTLGPDLIATGDFSFSGGTQIQRLARWNGSAWLPLGGGLDATGAALIGHRGTLYVGGSFNRAGGQLSPYLARFACACYANCDNSTDAPTLNIADFLCFLDHFAAATMLPEPQQVTDYANCDGSTAPPALGVADLVCFQQRFAAGCVR